MTHPQHIQDQIDSRRKRPHNGPLYCRCGEIAMYRVALKGFCEDHKEDAIKAGKKQSQKWITWAEYKYDYMEGF